MMLARSDYVIDESAQIDRDARVENSCIGGRTRVWQFASVIREAMVGEDCSIATCAIVDGAEIGDRCIVSHGAFIGPGMKIGKDVFIGPNVVFCNDAWPRVDKAGFEVAPMIHGDFIVTRIEDGASLGAGVVVLPGVVIGPGAMIAAGAVVPHNVPGKHLFKRNGSMVWINPTHSIQRMRRASGEC